MQEPAHGQFNFGTDEVIGGAAGPAGGAQRRLSLSPGGERNYTLRTRSEVFPVF